MLLKRRFIIAAVADTTWSTSPQTAPASLSASNVLWNAFDATIDYTIPVPERPSQGSMSQLPGVPGAQMGKLSFKTELFGSGTAATAPTWANLLFPACGLVPNTTNAYTFNLTSVVGSQTPLVLGKYEDGRFKSIRAALGNVKLEGEHGKPLMLHWEFSGLYVAPTDVALITPTYPTRIPPVLLSAALTVGSSTIAPVSKFSLDLGNKVSLRQDVTCATGYRSAVIADRLIKGTLDPEAVAVATKDVYGQWLAGTLAALSLTVGGTAGNQLVIAAPNIQYAGVKEGNRNELLTDDLDFHCRSTTGADDELTLSFT